MAQAQKKVAQAKKAAITKDAERQLEIIEDLNAATKVDKTEDLVNNTLQIWEIRKIVSGSRPKDASKKAVYDAALGNRGKDEARAELDEALVNAFSSLSLKVRSAKDVREKDVRKLIPILSELYVGAQKFEQREIYGPYSRILTHINELKISLERKEPPTKEEAEELIKPVKKERLGMAVSEEELRLPTRMRFEMGPLHWISTQGNVRYFSVGGELNDHQLSIFGGTEYRDAGNKFIGALGNALAAWRGEEAQHIGCDVLLDALGGVTHPQILDNLHFQKAKELLQAGQRDAALDELRHEDLGPLFRSVYETAGNLVIARLDNKAVKVFTGDFTFVWETEHMKKFMAWMSGYGEEYPGAGIVYWAITASVESLYVGGYLEKEKFDLDTGKFVPTGEPRKKIEARGIATSIAPELGIGTTLGGKPFIIRAQFTVGYRDVELKDPLMIRAQSGEFKGKKVRYQSPFVDVWGFDFILPGYWAERLRVGAVGHPKNAFVSFTFSPAYKRTASMWVGALITPFYQGFMAEASKYTPSRYKPQPGLEIEPVRFIKEFANGQKIVISPRGRIQYNAADKICTIDSSLLARWKFASAWELGVDVGYIRDEPIGSAAAIYPAVYGRVGLTVTPGAGKRRELPGMAGITPRRVEEERESPVVRLKREADEFAAKATEKQLEEKGPAMAKRLADSVEGSIIMSGDMWVRDLPEYEEAMRLLRAGDLRAGLKELSKVIG